jgi:hypothetical protein
MGRVYSQNDIDVKRIHPSANGYMTHEGMMQIAAQLVHELEPQQAGEFAGILKAAIIASYNDEQLKVIDEQLLSNGVDVTPICRTKHPPAPTG